VYSRRITGKIIVKHPNLIPNAARSDFENNTTRQAFLEALPKFTYSVDRWANEIQEDDRAREVLAQLGKGLSDINGKLPELRCTPWSRPFWGEKKIGSRASMGFFALAR